MQSLTAATKHLSRLAKLLAITGSILVSCQQGMSSLVLKADEGRVVRVLAFGDSLIHGYGLAKEDSFPVQLQRALQAQGLRVEVINGGNSGDTTAGGLARLDWALTDSPDAVLVELGANDALRGVEPSEAHANLDAILTKLGEKGLPVLLAGMLAPRNLGPDYAAEFDALYPSLAEQHGVPLYPFFLDGVAADPALNQSDGIHPNAAGIAVIVEKITPYVADLVIKVTADRND